MKESFAVAFVFALLAGAAMGIQPGANSRLARNLDHPLQAALISFTTGLTALLILAVAFRVRPPALDQLRAIPLVNFSGGLLGAFMVTVAILFANRLGAATWGVLLVTGQTLVTLVLDHYGLLGFAHHPLTWQRILGALLLLVGILLISRY